MRVHCIAGAWNGTFINLHQVHQLSSRAEIATVTPQVLLHGVQLGDINS